MGHKIEELQVILVPFHGKAHMNPMLQFGKRLASRGVNVTIATTTSLIQNMMPSAISAWESITVEAIYDNVGKPSATDFRFLAEFEAGAPPNLARLLAAKKEQAPSNRCLLVYHYSMSWARDVAQQNDVYSAVFFTLGSVTFLSYYALYLKSEGKGEQLMLPEFMPPPELVLEKLPAAYWSEVPKGEQYHPVIKWTLNLIADTIHADMLLINSFDELEKEAIEWMSKIWKMLKTVGPTLPSTYLDKRLQKDVVYGLNSCSRDYGDCIKWLDTQPASSVVYLAFGSIAHLSAAQMVEIAEALKQSPSRFLWAVSEKDQAKLPNDFMSDMSSSDKGLVVSWSPQLEVLAHSAVGCFVSHCGWNSTLEALSFGVPVLAMPQFLDQPIDAHLLEKFWGVGIVAPTTSEDGLVAREVIERCLEVLMSGEKGKKFKEKAATWKALAKEAVDEGGSSDKHIDEIIDWLASSQSYN